MDTRTETNPSYKVEGDILIETVTHYTCLYCGKRYLTLKAAQIKNHACLENLSWLDRKT